MAGERKTKEKKLKKEHKQSKTTKPPLPAKIVSSGPPSVINVIFDTELEEPKKEEKTNKSKGKKKNKPSRLDTFLGSGGDIRQLKQLDEASSEESSYQDEPMYPFTKRLPSRKELESLGTEKTSSTLSSDFRNFSNGFLVTGSTEGRSKQSDAPPSPHTNQRNGGMGAARKDWLNYLGAQDGPRLEDLHKELDFIQDVIDEKRRDSLVGRNSDNHHLLMRQDESFELEQVKSDWKKYSKRGKTRALHQELDSIKSLLQEHKLRTLGETLEEPNPYDTARKPLKSRTRSLHVDPPAQHLDPNKGIRKRPSALF